MVEEIYLAVLNRLPTAKERADGIAALEAAGGDHAKMMAEHKQKVDAFQAYQKTVPDKQKALETGLRNQKPTEWTTLELHSANSKQGPPATAKPGATLTINKDGSVLASGKLESLDLYTVVGLADLGRPITALKLEVLTDPSLPGEGAGPRGQRQLRPDRVPRDGAKPHRQAGRGLRGPEAHEPDRDLPAGRLPGQLSRSTATARPAGRWHRNSAAITPRCSASPSRLRAARSASRSTCSSNSSSRPPRITRSASSASR